MDWWNGATAAAALLGIVVALLGNGDTGGSPCMKVMRRAMGVEDEK